MVIHSRLAPSLRQLLSRLRPHKQRYRFQLQLSHKVPYPKLCQRQRQLQLQLQLLCLLPNLCTPHRYRQIIIACK